MEALSEAGGCGAACTVGPYPRPLGGKGSGVAPWSWIRFHVSGLWSFLAVCVRYSVRSLHYVYCIR